jgi:uncharacterized protein YbaR (Trm112 family)
MARLRCDCNGAEKVKVYDAREICRLFDRGINIIEWINEQEGARHNSPAAILYSYDAQAGSYTAMLGDPAIREVKDKLGRHLAAILDDLAPASLLDAGTGEATSLSPILGYMRKKPAHILGFDVSLSRLLFARQHLASEGVGDAQVFTARLDRIPLESASVDVVLTMHALEPNHGYEEAILADLLRVARKHLVLVEPSYETASAEARARMDRLGYVRGIPDALKRLGQNVRIEPIPYNTNPLNEAVLFIVEKGGPALTAPTANGPSFISPISGAPLLRRQDCLYCPHDGHAFPVIAGIPCLTLENALLASKLGQFT